MLYRFLLLLSFFGFLTLSAFAKPGTNQITDNNNKSLPWDDGTQLKILSWNIYMLPSKTFMKTGQKERAKLIVKTLNESDYDLIVFQEAFHKKAFNILQEGLKNSFPYQAGPANKSGLLKTNSGIWIVSKLPIKEIGRIKFKECKGVDCFARKGALMVEAEKNGHTFQILGTHMQAGFFPKIHKKQFKQINKELIEANHKAGVPQILCGDFNIDQSSDSYNDLIQTIDASNGPLEGEYQYTSSTNDYGKPGSVIDYIFYRSNNKKPIQLKRRIKRFTSNWTFKNKKRKDLSDHFSVEMVLEW